MVTRVLLSLLPLWIICLGMMLLPGLLLTGCMSSWLLLMFLIRRIRSFWLRLILGLLMGFLSGFLRLLIVVCGSILILLLWMLFGLFISLLRGILRGLDLLLFKSILLFGGVLAGRADHQKGFLGFLWSRGWWARGPRSDWL